jgi:hypothetical protein
MNAPTKDDFPIAEASAAVMREDTTEFGFIGTLQGLKYEYRKYRKDLRDRIMPFEREAAGARAQGVSVATRNTGYYEACGTAVMHPRQAANPK